MSTLHQKPDDGERPLPVEEEVCPLCEAEFVFVREEATFAPTSTVYACADHREHGEGACPGTELRVYEDGHVSRRVYGQGVTPMSVT